MLNCSKTMLNIDYILKAEINNLEKAYGFLVIALWW